MPNFNGAIIMHTMELIKSPATLREIVMTIAQNTELPPEDIKMPVKQTLEMGLRSGFLQKAEGRYYLEPITFTHLMSEIRALDPSDNIEKLQGKKVEKSLKTSSKTAIKKIPSSQIIKNPKPTNEGTHRNSNIKPKGSLKDDNFKTSNTLTKMPLIDNISLGVNNKTISDSKKKSVTSVAIKPRRITNK
ncbi:uncharacterized protein LOC110181165 [Drosophila serrata]|uniref:uncharacterized protein LOC110181165 n=1 Tax=Drosophila serrata TaxID=7274 RepID=UPI000A1D3112|nr:uncharacterized protein LOC110181165 [Drosophila serrata]